MGFLYEHRAINSNHIICVSSLSLLLQLIFYNLYVNFIFYLLYIQEIKFGF